MLLAFRTANHRSLRDEQQLSLTPVYEADRPSGTHWDAVPVVGLFGANASGKSNVVDALAHLRRMVLQSDRLAEPHGGIARYPFALESHAEEAPSWYVVDFTINDVRHTYGVALSSVGVTEEWLYWYPRKKKQTIFHRTKQAYKYGVESSAGRLSTVEPLVPENILFISAAARIGMRAVTDSYKWFRQLIVPRPHSTSDSLLRFLGDDPIIPLLEVESTRLQVLELLKLADFGIEDITAEPTRTSSDSSVDRLLAALSNTSGQRKQVWLTMKGLNSQARLSLEDQSAGTRTFLNHLPDVLKTLAQGSVLVIDELESDLHPLLAEQVVKLFQNPDVNRRRAQLVFTTHNTSTLASNGEILKRDQIWFVEKNPEDGSSSLYPLSAFKPRVEENTERRYLHGAYGAIPFIDEQRISAVLGALVPSRDEDDG